MSLIARIESAMQSDTESPDKQSRILEAVYESADPAGKALLDEALVCIAGYTLGRLIAGDVDDGDEGESERAEDTTGSGYPYLDMALGGRLVRR